MHTKKKSLLSRRTFTLRLHTRHDGKTLSNLSLLLLVHGLEHTLGSLAVQQVLAASVDCGLLSEEEIAGHAQDRAQGHEHLHARTQGELPQPDVEGAYAEGATSVHDKAVVLCLVRNRMKVLISRTFELR